MTSSHEVASPSGASQQGTPGVAPAIITASGLGVRFRRNRGARRSFKDLFAGKQRRAHTGEFWALRDVSFTVHAGEAIGVVGRNGQGKSTLLKLVAGVLLPDTGHVTVHGGVAPLIELVGNWRDYLRLSDESEIQSLHLHEKTGRPLGGATFIKTLENQLERLLSPQKRGPKKQGNA